MRTEVLREEYRVGLGVRFGRSWIARLLRNPPATAGAVVVLTMVVVAVFATQLAPYKPTEPNYDALLEQPSRAHWLGTDELGRDVLSRMMFASRVSLLVGAMAVAMGVMIGMPLGLVAGYLGRWAEQILMRIMDSVIAFPALVLALGISAAMGAKLTNAVIAIGIIGVPVFARLAHGQTLSVRERDFVTAARALGNTHLGIMTKHIFPNITTPIIVQATLFVAQAILLEAALSFLGVGVRPPQTSLGSMLRLGSNYMQLAPWLSVFPGVVLVIVVLAINFLGDGLADALNPRLRR